jgi:hypothetical protein
MPSESVDHPLAGISVIYVERVMVQPRNLRFARRTGCLGLGVDNPLDRCEHAFAHACIECPHAELDNGLVGNDILFSTRLQRTHGDDGSLSSGELTRDDRLKPHHCRGRHHDGIGM